MPGACLETVILSNQIPDIYGHKKERQLPLYRHSPPSAWHLKHLAIILPGLKIKEGIAHKIYCRGALLHFNPLSFLFRFSLEYGNFFFAFSTIVLSGMVNSLRINTSPNYRALFFPIFQHFLFCPLTGKRKLFSNFIYRILKSHFKLLAYFY